MKKIDTSKSVIFSKKIADLKASLEYVGEEGYFSNFEDLSVCINGALKSVLVGDDVCHPYASMYDSYCYSFFIPKSLAVFVEEEPKKYRPYKNIYEFCNETGCEAVGEDVITIRTKKDKQEKLLLFTGYSETAVHLGAYLITFNGLLCDYEFLYDGEWCPLGIEE